MSPPEVIQVWVCRGCGWWGTFPSPHCCAAPDCAKTPYVCADLR